MTATIYYQSNKVSTRDYQIYVDRESAIMTFSFKLHRNNITFIGGQIDVSVYSAPFSKSDRAEFGGKRLSEEKYPHPNGLGEGIRKEDVSKRTFKKSIVVKIEDCYEE